FVYYTLTALPFAESVVIHHLSPILAAILAAALLGERLSVRLAIAMSLSLAGVVAIARPTTIFGSDVANLPPWGVAAGLLGAVATAFVVVLIRKLGSREDPLVIVFYFPLV